MRCDDALHILSESDEGGFRGLWARLHLMFCPECRELHERELETMEALAVYNPFPVPKNFADEIMARIELLEEQEPATHNPMPMSGWVGAGLLILLGMPLLQFSASHLWLKGQLGRALEVPLFIAMGIIITVYIALFIGTHLDDFMDRFGLRKRERPTLNTR
jgi:predicted anti-sigma-YlaC factor YlaD